MIPRVVVIGAGLSGLTTARELQAAGVEVLVLDKGRSPGGRLATRRIGAATLDHGAQFFTTRTPEFSRRVDDWTQRGLVEVWTQGFGHGVSHPRFIARAGMNSLAKDLAVGLTVSCSTTVSSVRQASSRWEIVVDDGTVHTADRVVVTAPLPQSSALLSDSSVELDPHLMAIDYDRTIALLAVLDRSPSIAPPGGLQRPTGDVDFLADNAAKGVSAVPAITMHASAAWSQAHWDEQVGELEAALTELAGPWLGDARVVESQVKKWRFATPRDPWPAPCWAPADGRLVLAGDVFDGPRIEAAYCSGLAAAKVLLG